MSHPGPQPDTDGSLPDATARSPAADPDYDIVDIRNYDHWEGHSVSVTVVAPDGEPVVHERRYLAPGQSTRLSASIAPGEYHLRVQVDGVERARADQRFDRTSAGTAVIELGNGVVSVTGGPASRIAAE